MFRAVIFDFDGVITDSEILHFQGFNEVLATYGVSITKEQYYAEFLGLSDKDLFTLLVQRKILNLDEKGIEDLIRKKNSCFEKLASEQGHIIAGVRDFLEMLDANHIFMAICSGALLSEIELILEQARLRGFFRTIVSADQVAKSKPDPEGFVLALNRLNEKLCELLTPDQCVVIEDARWGIEAAKKAKMHTVAITNSYKSHELQMADKVIDHLSELTIKDLNQLCS